MGKSKEKKSFSRAFFRGFSRALDLGGSKRSYAGIYVRDDYEALKGDWENVGKDIRKAVAKYAEADTV